MSVKRKDGVCFSFKIGRWRINYASSDSDVSKVYKIAIFSPAATSVVEQINKGLIDTLQEKSPLHFKFDSYNAIGHLSLMRKHIDTILNNKYDLIFCVGTLCATMAKQVSLYRQQITPIVFCAICDPVGLGLVASEESSGNHLTGVMAGESFHAQQTLLLCTIKRQLKRVLIVYDPTQYGGGIEGHKEEIEKILKRKNILVETLKVFEYSNLGQKVEPHLKLVDVVMVLRDNTVLSRIEDLISLCNFYGVTLLTSDWDSVNKGAALGFSASDYLTGVASADKICQILEDKKLPSQIPITIPPYRFKMKVNAKTMEMQSLNLNPEMLSLIEFGEMI